MKCLFKHEISLDDVGVGVPDDPFPFYVAANTVRLIFYILYIFSCTISISLNATPEAANQSSENGMHI